MYKSYFKRILELPAIIILLIILSPVFLILTIVLSIVNNGNIFFVQVRPGKNKREFKLIKFKTMLDLKDINGELLPDSMRLTAFGRFLRKTSLDEIPQLINVLKGEMSIIGPRPLLLEYMSLYNEDQIRRHEVLPGITGWAQVNGRNAISWERKFEFDVWYVDNVSFLLDLKIIGLTIMKVIRREGISGDGVETMTFFKGSKKV